MEVWGRVEKEDIVRDPIVAVDCGNLGTFSEMLNGVLMMATKKTWVSSLHAAGSDPAIEEEGDKGPEDPRG